MRLASAARISFPLIGFSTKKRRGALVLSNFLWRPIDDGAINIGMKLINPDLHAGDFNALYLNS
jgi:hypothetical protein